MRQTIHNPLAAIGAIITKGSNNSEFNESELGGGSDFVMGRRGVNYNSCTQRQRIGSDLIVYFVVLVRVGSVDPR